MLGWGGSTTRTRPRHDSRGPEMRQISEVVRALNQMTEQHKRAAAAVTQSIHRQFQRATAPFLEAMRQQHETLRVAMQPFVDAMRKLGEVQPKVVAYLIEQG